MNCLKAITCRAKRRVIVPLIVTLLGVAAAPTTAHAGDRTYLHVADCQTAFWGTSTNDSEAQYLFNQGYTALIIPFGMNGDNGVIRYDDYHLAIRVGMGYNPDSATTPGKYEWDFCARLPYYWHSNVIIDQMGATPPGW